MKPQRIKLEIGQTVWHGVSELVVIAENRANYLATSRHHADMFQRTKEGEWNHERILKESYRCPKNGDFKSDSPYSRWYTSREAADDFRFLVNERENIGREVRALEDPAILRRIQAILKEVKS